jgi:hypothetical protein
VDGLVEFLVKQKGFSQERVLKGIASLKKSKSSSSQSRLVRGRKGSSGTQSSRMVSSSQPSSSLRLAEPQTRSCRLELASLLQQMAIGQPLRPPPPSGHT